MKKAPVGAAVSEQDKSLLFVHCCLEGSAGRKLGHRCSSDLDGSTGAWVLTRTCSTLGCLERTESDQLDILLLSLGLDDGAKHSIEGACCTCFG